MTEQEAIMRVIEIVADLAGVEPHALDEDAIIAGSNGHTPILDSLDSLKLALVIEDEFGAPYPDLADLPDPITVQSVARYVLVNLTTAEGGHA